MSHVIALPTIEQPAEQLTKVTFGGRLSVTCTPLAWSPAWFVYMRMYVMSSAGLAVAGPVLAIPRSLVPVSAPGALRERLCRLGLPWTFSELPWNTCAPADNRPKKLT